jgi:PIN domain nuclease of toxin-antitoxin system
MLLLDTHIALWWLTGDVHLKKPIRTKMSSQPCAISVASLWEVAIKYRLGKLDISPSTFLEAIKEADVIIYPISEEQVITVGHMADGHHDPFDLLLLSIALLETASFVTADKKLADYAETYTSVKMVRA